MSKLKAIVNTNLPKITAYSTALFSTWIYLEDYDLLFDCGDGLTASLLQKTRKIKHVFISHADRDHLTGLLQFNQLNARNEFPKIYYPSDSYSFQAMQQFCNAFDPHVGVSQWMPIIDGQQIEIKPKIFVRAFRNEHVAVAQGIHKSLSFMVSSKKWKLKKEYQHLSGGEIGQLSKKHGKAFLSNEFIEQLIGYAGDTPVDDYSKWDHCKTLIHEATFITEDFKLNTKANKHSLLQQVMEMVANINLERLILNHFSSRYSAKEIKDAVLKYCKVYNIKLPVYCILPGKVHHDVLKDEPINS